MVKKIVLVGCLALMLSGCRSQKIPACDIKKGTGCAEVEENVELRPIIIGGIEPAYGDALIALWDEIYPEKQGLLQVQYGNDMQTAIDQQYDIVLTYEELAGLNQTELLQLDMAFTQSIYAGSSKAHEDVLPPIQPYFVPLAYEGIAFFYNETMLKSIGVDTITDGNQDGMPDAFDSWEKLFELADSWTKQRPMYRKKPVQIVFPFSLTESYMSYFMFTSQGFRLFPDHLGLDPGFQKDTFGTALRFITEASKHPMGVLADLTTYQAKDYIWQWEKVYTSQIAPFGLVAPWMDLQGAAKANKVTYLVTPYFPTFQGSSMVPFKTMIGYVARKTDADPGLILDVMTFLRSQEAMQLVVDTTTMIPYAYERQELDFHDNINRRNWQQSLSISDSQPLIALPNNFYKKALDGYYEINVMDVIKRLWDGKLTVREAQAELDFLYRTWLFKNTSVNIESKKQNS